MKLLEQVYGLDSSYVYGNRKNRNSIELSVSNLSNFLFFNRKKGLFGEKKMIY